MIVVLYFIIIFLFFIFFLLAGIYIVIENKDFFNYEIKENKINNINNVNNVTDELERIIPDNIHPNKSTRRSTQNVDCKKYNINNKSAKNEINQSTIDYSFIENIEENIEEKDYYISTKKEYNSNDDSPIKEVESIFSKLFKGPDKL